MIEFFRPNLAVSGASSTVRLYWIATGLFTLLFAASILLGLGDLKESYTEYTRLGFTEPWQVYFNSLGKIFGLLAIYHNRSRTLKDFAFAGFFFDLLLALVAHIAQGESKFLIPLVSLGIWWFAFAMNRKVFPVNDRV
ncbi:DoxX family protein [Deinococcus altitudinis]|uniref:DoxX family protein n=1 Tax=Deinococcus altitudinis TaxID=468914 RepID=UPI003892AE3A